MTEDYSRDADQTRLIFIIGRIALTFLVGVLFLEMLAMILFFIKFVAYEKQATFKYQAFIFSSEITHAMLPVTVGAVGAVAAFLFGKEVGKRMGAEEESRRVNTEKNGAEA